MIELSGYRRTGDIEVVFTGVRPGEKLFEELQYGGEAMDTTRHPKIFIGRIAGLTTDGAGSWRSKSCATSRTRARATRSARSWGRSCPRRS